MVSSYRAQISDREQYYLINSRADTSLPSLFHERELAWVVDDIAGLIEEVSATPSKPMLDTTRFGNLFGTMEPCGVSVIVSQSDSPLRFAVAPFAASIAARNAVILAIVQPGKFFQLLQQYARASLDISAIHVAEMAQDEVDQEQVDHVLVIGKSILILRHCRPRTHIKLSILTIPLDDDQARWSKTLASPKAFYCPVVSGFNLAVIGEGAIAPEKLAELLILAEDKSQHKADMLTAVFVHTANLQAMTSALSKASHESLTRLSSAASSERLKPQIYTLALASTNPADLTTLLTSARSARALLLLETTSLDQVIDAVRKIANINQLAFLNPATPQMQAYFHKWTRSAVFSAESFLPTTPSCEFLLFFSFFAIATQHKP